MIVPCLVMSRTIIRIHQNLGQQTHIRKRSMSLGLCLAAKMAAIPHGANAKKLGGNDPSGCHHPLAFSSPALLHTALKWVFSEWMR